MLRVFQILLRCSEGVDLLMPRKLWMIFAMLLLIFTTRHLTFPPKAGSITGNASVSIVDAIIADERELLATARDMAKMLSCRIDIFYYGVGHRAETLDYAITQNWNVYTDGVFIGYAREDNVAVILQTPDFEFLTIDEIGAIEEILCREYTDENERLWAGLREITKTTYINSDHTLTERLEFLIAPQPKSHLSALFTCIVLSTVLVVVLIVKRKRGNKS